MTLAELFKNQMPETANCDARIKAMHRTFREVKRGNMREMWLGLTFYDGRRQESGRVKPDIEQGEVALVGKRCT